MIKAIVFDWGGVLIDHPVAEMNLYCAQKLHVDIKLLMQTFLKYKTSYQKALITEDEVWDKICNEIGGEKPTVRSLCREALQASYSPKKEMFDLARNLKNNGYKTGLLSNTEIPMMGFFKEQKYDMFDVTVFSCAEGTVKPEQKIYEILLNRLEVDASEAVFIDDIQEFINGAQNIGMKTILFENANQVISELTSLGININ